MYYAKPPRMDVMEADGALSARTMSSKQGSSNGAASHNYQQRNLSVPKYLDENVKTPASDQASNTNGSTETTPNTPNNTLTTATPVTTAIPSTTKSSLASASASWAPGPPPSRKKSYSDYEVDTGDELEERKSKRDYFVRGGSGGLVRNASSSDALHNDLGKLSIEPTKTTTTTTSAMATAASDEQQQQQTQQRSFHHVDVIGMSSPGPIKSSLKPSCKPKPGVKFHDSPEVFEVKNPHYGLDIKSEKREMRRRRKDRQKEEDMIIKTKLEMRLRIQQQQAAHYVVG